VRRGAAEAFEVFQSAVEGAASGVHAALEAREGVLAVEEGFGGCGGLLEVVVLGKVMDLFVPELGFDAVKAAEEPLVANELVDEGSGLRSGGLIQHGSPR